MVLTYDIHEPIRSRSEAPLVPCANQTTGEPPLSDTLLRWRDGLLEGFGSQRRTTAAYFGAPALGRLHMPTAYRVYVIELARRVFNEDARFRAANPQFNGVQQCLYVGMTSKTPQERLQQHKTGYRNAKGHKLSANIVERYGLYLRPSLYQHIGPMTRAEALAVEKGLAMELRRKGYAVWTN